MTQFHSTEETAFDKADTPVEDDTRIQNLNFRDDTVLNSAPIFGDDKNNVIDGTVGNDNIDAKGGNDTSRAATATTSSPSAPVTTRASAATATTPS